MANSRETHRRWTFKDVRHLIALAASRAASEQQLNIACPRSESFGDADN
jgi:hypothetical protein